MNFEEAIRTHTEWKTKLRWLASISEDIDCVAVGRDDKCELGQWIYGEGANYGGNLAYEELRTRHARFHRCAATVAAKANNRDIIAVEALLGPDGEFSDVSESMLAAIRRLMHEVRL